MLGFRREVTAGDPQERGTQGLLCSSSFSPFPAQPQPTEVRVYLLCPQQGLRRHGQRGPDQGRTQLSRLRFLSGAIPR